MLLIGNFMHVLRVAIIVVLFFIVQPFVLAQQSHVVKSNQQAGQLVKKKYGGKVLRVNKNNNQSAYLVKLLQDNGHVISVIVNAKTGKSAKR